MYVKDKELHLVWCVQDVKETGKACEIELTEEECVEVLHVVLDRHNCNFGVSWYDIKEGIKEVKSC